MMASSADPGPTPLIVWYSSSTPKKQASARAAYRKTELSASDFESAIGREPDLVVAHDPVLFGTAANNGQVIGAMNARNKVVDGFAELAKLIGGMEPPKIVEKKKSALSFLTRK